MEIDALRTRHVEEFADIVSPNLFKSLPMVVQAHFQPNADDFNKPVFLDKQVEVELDVINKGDDNTTVKLCNSLPVTFTPMTVSRFKLEQTPFQHAIPENFDSKEAPYCLRVELSPLSGDVDVQQALTQPIQLHFSNESIGRNVADIINQAVKKVAICVADDEFAYDIGEHNFHPLLADDDFLISPIKSNEVPVYFKLKEYFSIPAKRQFFILKNPHKINVAHGKSVYIDFYLNELGAVLLEEKNLSVKINKTLFSNLFHQSSEPVRVNYQELSYPVIADASQRHIQIYSIDKVYVVTSAGQKEIPPVVGTQTVDFQSQLYWSQSNKLGHIESADKAASLDEVKHLVLPINRATKAYPNGFTAFAEISCYDAQLANKIHVGNQIVVNTEEALAGEFEVGGVTIQPSSMVTDEKNYWSLLKLMSFNLSQLLQAQDAKATLIGFLKLFVNANATHQELNSIYDVTAKKMNAPFLVENRMIFVPGMSLTLTLDNSELNADFSLFAELLNDFLAAQTPFDRCSQLTVKYTSYNWPAKRFEAQLGARVCS
ncbi:type VI secretion system baseplate subunit TssF [Pseudoalteromonas piscicida]